MNRSLGIFLLAFSLSAGCVRAFSTPKRSGAVEAGVHDSSTDGSAADAERDGGPDSGIPVVPSQVGWVRAFHGPGPDIVTGLGVSAQGDVVLAGTHEGGLDLGEGPIASDGGLDSVVISIDARGVNRWVRTLYGPEDVQVNDVAIDAEGYVYAVGVFSTTLTVESATLTSSGDVDAFVVAFAPDGTLRWTRAVGDATGGDNFYGAAVDAAGNLTVCGWLNGSFDFGGGVVLASRGPEQDALVVGYTRTGELRYATRIGGASLDQGQGIDVGPEGAPALAGLYVTETELMSGVEASRGARDAFVVRLDSSGDPIWSRTFGSTGTDEANEIAITEGGTIVLGGLFASLVDFGGGGLEGGAGGAFVAAYDANGAHLWSQALHSTAEVEQVEGLHRGLGDSVLVAGRVGGPIEIGGLPIGQSGSTDAFWALLDRDGRALAAETYGGGGFDNARAAVQAFDGTIYVTGRFQSTATVGDRVLTSAGSSDIYLVQLVP